jgi:hypothetical protein
VCTPRSACVLTDIITIDIARSNQLSRIFRIQHDGRLIGIPFSTYGNILTQQGKTNKVKKREKNNF